MLFLIFQQFFFVTFLEISNGYLLYNVMNVLCMKYKKYILSLIFNSCLYYHKQTLWSYVIKEKQKTHDFRTFRELASSGENPSVLNVVE